jgi:D-alanine-D-alanine ligase
MSKSLRILLLMHEDLMPPETVEGLSDKEIAPFKTEYDVWAGLVNLGHQVMKLGVYDDLGVIRHAIETFKPHITFNLLEEFHGESVYRHAVVSYLELLKQPYTGCNARGLMLGHDKALSKQILAYHRISVPQFAVFDLNKKVRRPRKLQFPLVVKSVSEEGSVGISQKSIVHDDEHLIERVEFIHRKVGTDAIAERYINGREFYVGVMGNARLQTLPVWELTFTNLPEGSEPIATSKVKWDYGYQKKVGVSTQQAKQLDESEVQRIYKLCKRVYRALGLTGYARMDLRLNGEGQVYLIEANPNPQLAYGEDFAESAHSIGIEYGDLLAKILALGLSYRAAWALE